MRRGWAVAGLVGVAGVAAGVAATIAAQGDSDPSLTAVATAVDTSQPTPIPWIDSRWVYRTPTPTATPDLSGIPLCPDEQLGVAFKGADSGTGGQLIARFEVTASGDSACVFSGDISLDINTASGEVLSAAARHTELLVRSDGIATFAVSWRIHSGAGGCDQKAEPATEIRVQMGGVTRTMPAVGTRLDDARFTPCGSVYFFGSESFPRATATATPPTPIDVQLLAPPSVTAGMELAFLAVLTNHGPTSYEWGAKCPGYAVDLQLPPVLTGEATISENLVLNCAPVPALAPGESATFEMRLSIPKDTEPGDWMLYWGLIEPFPGTDKPWPSAPVTVKPP